MKLTGVSTVARKWMAIGLVAAAAAFVPPAQAHAQQFAVGVQFGSPYFHDDGRREFYEHERWERERAEIARQEAWQRHEAWEQHERWERARSFDRRGGGWYATPYGSPASRNFGYR